MADIEIVQRIVRILAFVVPALLYGFAATLLALCNVGLARLQERIGRRRR